MSVFAVLVNPYAEGNRFRIKEITEDEPEDWHLYIGKDERVLAECDDKISAEMQAKDFLKFFDLQNNQRS